MYVYTSDVSYSQTLNQRLWDWKEDSFSHGLLSDPQLPTNTPIIIGTTQPPAHINHLLINLHHEVPPFYAQFQRICEIVPQDEAGKVLSRQKYQYYKHLGITPEVHHIQ